MVLGLWKKVLYKAIDMTMVAVTTAGEVTLGAFDSFRYDGGDSHYCGLELSV